MYQNRTLLDWPIIRLLPAAWAMATIWWLSDQSELPKPPDFNLLDWNVLGHFTIFGLLGLGVWWALGMNSQLLHRERTWYAIGIAGLYGVLDELHQYFVPGRQTDVLDVLTDFLGAAVFVIVIPRLYQKMFG